jgi:transposase
VVKKAKQYTASFRANAVKLAVESGRPTPEVARDLDVPYHTLWYWMQKAKAGSLDRPALDRSARPGGAPLETAEEEVRRLRRELDEVKMERDFLKKAAAFFARMNK